VLSLLLHPARSRRMLFERARSVDAVRPREGPHERMRRGELELDGARDAPRSGVGSPDALVLVMYHLAQQGVERISDAVPRVVLLEGVGELRYEGDRALPMRLLPLVDCAPNARLERAVRQHCMQVLLPSYRAAQLGALRLRASGAQRADCASQDRARDHPPCARDGGALRLGFARLERRRA
jgi:hypothetical protein